MCTTGGSALVLAGMLLAPSPAPSFSPGVGYTVSRLQRELDEPDDPEPSTSSARLPQAVRLAPHLPPPPGDFARLQGSPEARGIYTAVAVASQVAMIVAGVLAVRQQRQALRRMREQEVQPYRPYR